MDRLSKLLISLILVFATFVGFGGFATAASVTITNNGFQFTDTSGNVIQAHGGGVIKVGSYYYWFGENRNNDGTFKAVSCYRSTDLKNWTYRGDVLTSSSAAELNVSNIERPKVIYNSSTGQYVMWMHWENGVDYGQARTAVAYSSTVDGTYTYQGSFRPLGYDSRDMTVYNDGGTAYLISATNVNADLNIYKLTSDFKGVDSLVQTLWTGSYREAPAMFKRGSTYFLVTSGATGWSPNQQKYATATSIGGTWSSLTNFGNGNAYNSQAAYILPVDGSSATSYLYMGDRWAGAWGGKVNDSEYVWLPLTFPSSTSLSMSWADSLTVDTAAGTISGTASPPVNTSSYYKIINRNSGLLLGVTSGATTDGAQIEQWTDGGWTSQHWQFVDMGGGYYKIKNRNSGKIMDISGGSTADGANDIQYADNGGLNQQFRLISVGSGYYKIMNVKSRKVLDITGASTVNGADAIQNADSGATNQQFSFSTTS
ncbi:RICIN domain-containing protein [Cohnella sp. AR92]|uniref:RICIN domain-containing protein n=1 Tax=Cohnella sp. AR92 TaxID=648716 RepID=UPI000F8D9998|nr:RICIN domain-containing protein [Cohnella sp. AR92]RUS45216.1 beta-xylosidase [Cohnella sp. AR92]